MQRMTWPTIVAVIVAAASWVALARQPGAWIAVPVFCTAVLCVLLALDLLRARRQQS